MSEAVGRARSRSGTQTRKKLHMVTTAYDPDDFAKLEEAASRAGLSRASYQRVQTLGTPPKTRSTRRAPIEREMLARALGQLGKVGAAILINLPAPRIRWRGAGRDHDDDSGFTGFVAGLFGSFRTKAMSKAEKQERTNFKPKQPKSEAREAAFAMLGREFVRLIRDGENPAVAERHAAVELAAWLYEHCLTKAERQKFLTHTNWIFKCEFEPDDALRDDIGSFLVVPDDVIRVRRPRPPPPIYEEP